MIGDALKLSVYFGDALTAGDELASDALMECFARRDVRVAALLRGVEGFGINRRIHAERFPDVSTDLPLLGVAVDERARIERLRDDVDGIVSRGLVTLEHALLASGDDVADAVFPETSGRSAKLTIYCSRGERAHGRPAFREAVDLLRRHGAAGAIVLLGVDGVLRGRRRKARLLMANADTPTRRHADTPTRRHADTPTRRHADTPTRRHADTPTRRHADTPTRRHADDDHLGGLGGDPPASAPSPARTSGEPARDAREHHAGQTRR